LRSDKLLFWSTLTLLAASVVMVYSASAVQSLSKYESSSHFLLRQLAWAVIGLVLMLGIMRVDYHEYRRPIVIWSLLTVVVIGLLGVFLFKPTNHAQRWLSFAGVSVQPSELAKLAAILFTAALLERRMHRINEIGYALAPIGLVTLVLTALIVKEPDFGTSVMIVLVVIAIVFAAGLHYRYLFGVMLMLLPAAMFLVMYKSYRLKRMLIFLDPWQDPMGDGFQPIQSLLAVGSGGAFGKGLMAGVQKLFYLPEPHTDFIYAVISEELGLIGATAILVCFAVITWRGLRIASRAEDSFGAFVALGLTTMIAVQAFVNMSVVLGLLPTKGMPLPLVSAGGSSMLVNLLGIGVLLNVSQHQVSGA